MYDARPVRDCPVCNNDVLLNTLYNSYKRSSYTIKATIARSRPTCYEGKLRLRPVESERGTKESFIHYVLVGVTHMRFSATNGSIRHCVGYSLYREFGELNENSAKVKQQTYTFVSTRMSIWYLYLFMTLSFYKLFEALLLGAVIVIRNEISYI